MKTAKPRASAIQQALLSNACLKGMTRPFRFHTAKSRNNRTRMTALNMIQKRMFMERPSPVSARLFAPVTQTLVSWTRLEMKSRKRKSANLISQPSRTANRCAVARRRRGALRALDALDAPQEFFDLRHASFRLVSENVLAVDGDAHVTRSAGFDFGFDTELFLRSLLQAHGRMTQVHSKETALDVNLHVDSLSLRVRSGTGVQQANGFQYHVACDLHTLGTDFIECILRGMVIGVVVAVVQVNDVCHRHAELGERHMVIRHRCLRGEEIRLVPKPLCGLQDHIFQPGR